MGCFISNPSVLEKYVGETLMYQPAVSNETTSIYINSKNVLWKVCKGEPEVIRKCFMNNYRVKRLPISPMIVSPQRMLKISKNEMAISMNYYPGDLFSFTLAPFDFKKVLNGLQNIVDAIKFLHTRDLAHRDIKPENIVVDQEYFRLIDFDFTSPLVHFVKCGTKNYMYPFTTTLDWTARERSIRFDIYAFGRTILYVFYCAAQLKMIEHPKRMKKLFTENVILKDVKNPFTTNSDVAYWFDVALKCCSEVPHLNTTPTANDTAVTLQMVCADEAVA